MSNEGTTVEEVYTLSMGEHLTDFSAREENCVITGGYWYDINQSKEEVRKSKI